MRALRAMRAVRVIRTTRARGRCGAGVWGTNSWDDCGRAADEARQQMDSATRGEIVGEGFATQMSARDGGRVNCYHGWYGLWGWSYAGVDYVVACLLPLQCWSVRHRQTWVIVEYGMQWQGVAAVRMWGGVVLRVVSRASSRPLTPRVPTPSCDPCGADRKTLIFATVFFFPISPLLTSYFLLLTSYFILLTTNYQLLSSLTTEVCLHPHLYVEDALFSSLALRTRPPLLPLHPHLDITRPPFTLPSSKLSLTVRVAVDDRDPVSPT